MTQLHDENIDATEDRHVGRPPAAALIRQALARARIAAIRLIGHPGSGKTELIEATLKSLPAPKRAAVIVVNPASGREAQRLRQFCGHVAHVDTPYADAAHIWQAISELKLENFDTILIEAAGGLTHLHDLGQDTTVAVFAVSGGDDKAAEYHILLKTASAVLLTKSDLRSFVKFDSKIFRDDVRAINSFAEVFELSATTGSGMRDWMAWLERVRATKRGDAARNILREGSTEGFVG